MNGSILIVGGSGSLGRALTERLLQNPPQRLVIYSRGEHRQEDMERIFKHDCLRYYIGDCRDLPRLEMAMRGIDTVIHCAALKVIPKCELDPIEAVNTNIVGAENVIRAALGTRVRKVLGISTDKACAPVNLYGATKLAQEKLFIAANNLAGNHHICFSLVRYGNVANSNGSVIPFFKARKEAGLPLPITHPEMTRFHITLDEAVDLVFYALEHMQGREIFVPRLPSFRVVDLAKAIAPDGKWPIVGIRPGEKIHETLITADEMRMTKFCTDADYYVISSRIVNSCENWPAYTSGTNDRWLTVEELAKL